MISKTYPGVVLCAIGLLGGFSCQPDDALQHAPVVGTDVASNVLVLLGINLKKFGHPDALASFIFLTLSRVRDLKLEKIPMPSFLRTDESSGLMAKPETRRLIKISC